MFDRLLDRLLRELGSRLVNRFNQLFLADLGRLGQCLESDWLFGLGQKILDAEDAEVFDPRDLPSTQGQAVDGFVGGLVGLELSFERE